MKCGLNSTDSSLSSAPQAIECGSGRQLADYYSQDRVGKLSFNTSRQVTHGGSDEPGARMLDQFFLDPNTLELKGDDLEYIQIDVSIEGIEYSISSPDNTTPNKILLDAHFCSGSILENKQMFNIICELTKTVARILSPRMRVVKGSGKAINYLTPPWILLALVTAWLRRGRWFDDQGGALYATEADKIHNWAESIAPFSFTDAMEMYAEKMWVSIFSMSLICAFIILFSSTGAFSWHIIL